MKDTELLFESKILLRVKNVEGLFKSREMDRVLIEPTLLQRELSITCVPHIFPLNSASPVLVNLSLQSFRTRFINLVWSFIFTPSLPMQILPICCKAGLALGSDGAKIFSIL